MVVVNLVPNFPASTNLSIWIKKLLDYGVTKIFFNRYYEGFLTYIPK